MDGVTILAAGLVGAGAAFMGVTLAAVGRRWLRTRPRRGEPRPVPGPRSPGGRKVPVAPRAATGLRSRAPGVPAGAGYRGGPPPEALGGETLQLGPVPAWRLPVGSRPDGAAAPVPRAPRGALFGRRRSVYKSAAAVADDEQAGRDPRAAPGAASVVNNASRRHDQRTAPGRSTGR